MQTQAKIAGAAALIVLPLAAGAYLVAQPSGHATRVLGERVLGSGSSRITVDRSSTGNDKGNGNDKKNFTIGGQVTGLYPGSDRPLVLTFSNPNGSSITVTAVTVQAEDSPSGCPGSVLSFSGFQQTTVPGKGTAQLTLTAHMAATVDNNCANNTWVLNYSGTARQK